jgi:hypothetical protein
MEHGLLDNVGECALRDKAVARLDKIDKIDKIDEMDILSRVAHSPPEGHLSFLSCEAHLSGCEATLSCRAVVGIARRVPGVRTGNN